ncbi:MAG: serine hydrolase domain-containing protein [bacterium]
MEKTTGPEIWSAREAGMDGKQLDRLVAHVRKETSGGLYDGAVLLVARGGKVVLHEAVGFTDLEKKRAADRDDVFFLMSMTKQMTTTVVLSRIDRGELSLTTRVAEVIPEFGVRGKQRITVGQLLTHTAGISPEMPPTLPLDQIGNLQAYVAAACEMRLVRVPGQGVSYNPFTAHAILAEMVRRLDRGGRPFRRILADELFGPLGMKDTSMGLRPDLAPRRVPVVVRDRTPSIFEPALLEATNFLFTEETEIPAGGAFSTVRDIYRFTEMLRHGGELDGVRVLSPSILRLALTNHTGLQPNDIFDCLREMHGWPEIPAFLGLGFFLRGEGAFPTYLGQTTSPGTFAGLGAGSTMFWVDPERDLTFVCLTAGLPEEGASILRFQRLSDLVVAAATH